MAGLLTSTPRMGEGEAPTMTDPIFNRLLKDRIIYEILQRKICNC